MLCAWLCACGENSLEDRGGRYMEAVAGALGQASPPANVRTRAMALPRRRARLVEIEERRIGVFDFLSIQGCELGVLAGHNMSALGRQMPLSSRLTHELTVLEVGDGCVGGLDDAERRLELQAILEVKRGERGAHAWNAIWAGPEMEAYLSRSETAALASAEGAGAARALAGLTRRLDELGPRESDGLAVAEGLARLRESPPLGRALRDLEVATAQLDAVSALLEPLDVQSCTPREARLMRAFRETYLQFVQVPLARAHRRADAELPQLFELARASQAALEATGRPAPREMSAWFSATLDRDARDGLWARYMRAVHRHVAAWAPVLSVCGALPGVEERVAVASGASAAIRAAR
jgi:hypothetical protein